MSYCTHCKRVVEGQTKFSWLAFVVGTFIFGCIVPFWGGIGFFIAYIFYWALLKNKTCPICKMAVEK